MNIQAGEIILDKITEQRIMYKNKTKKYLLPCFKEYGEEFIHKIDDVFKVAVGIGDIIVKKRGFRHEKHLFILLDSTIAPDFFNDFIHYVRTRKDIYEDDYTYGNIQKSEYHMVILKFPERLYKAFETFKIGEYSKMFTAHDVLEFFSNHPIETKIITKNRNYRIIFTKKLNKVFDLKGDLYIQPEDWEGELDLPPQEKEEHFNYHLK